jgi:hypothetical protein
MKSAKKLLLLSSALFLCGICYSQIEVARLNTKGYSALGFGGYLGFDIPVSESGAVTLGAGFYSFKKEEQRVAIAPFIAGFRKQLDGSATGLYIQPQAGYTLGGSDITKPDEYGNTLYDDEGNEVNQKVKGITAGIGAGYIFSGNVPINLGLHYRRVFVADDPALNVLSLRLSYPLIFGRREY